MKGNTANKKIIRNYIIENKPIIKLVEIHETNTTNNNIVKIIKKTRKVSNKIIINSTK